MNIGSILNVAQCNSHISDARHAGNYTMCVFLLKMREYYRWENDIPLTGNIDKQGFGDWLVEREEMWERIEDQEYAPLPLPGGDLGHLETEQINRELEPHGYVYSAGYGLFHKPNFFIGRLLKKEQHGGITVYVSSCEYVRDMEAPPAMMLNGTIFIRKESLRRTIWEKIEEWQWNKQKPDTPMGRVMSEFGEAPDMEAVLDQLTEEQIDSIILHELGEVEAGRLLGGEWEEMLNECPRSKSELIIRAIRDNLADSTVTLPRLLKEAGPSSIHFYFSHFRGMRKAIFPELADAYERWNNTGDNSVLMDVADRGRSQWLDKGRDALAHFHANSTSGLAEIEALFPSIS